ncbi:MAG: hypothetical protein IJ112_07380 [Oscillospiraceae bacterium]|nr:hypothetical protein [Oscillospiraceae bacterium]
MAEHPSPPARGLTVLARALQQVVERKHQRNVEIAVLVRTLEYVWVLQVERPYVKVPYLDDEARAWIFSSAQAADNARGMLRFSGALRSVSFSQDRLTKEFSRWVRLGVREMALDPDPTDGSCRAVFKRDELLRAEHRHFGTDFNRITLGFQYDVARGNALAADGKWSAMLDWLHARGLVLVPVHVEGQSGNAPDWVLHYQTEAVFQRMNRYAVERELGDRLGAGRQVRPAGPEGNPVLLFRPEWFCGGEGYRFAVPGVDAPRRISPRVLQSGGRTFLCGFFDLETLRAVFGEFTSVGILSFTELVRYVGETDSRGRRVEGVVLSPGLTDLLLEEPQVREYLKYTQDPYVFRR